MTTHWKAWKGTILLTGMGICLLWVYWPTLAAMAEKWAEDPQYSHGWLVPLFSIFLLWQRYTAAQASPPADAAEESSTPTQAGGPDGKAKEDKRRGPPDWVWGAVLVVLALGMFLAGAGLSFDWFDGMSLLPLLAGFALLLGGWSALRWSWPAIAFLAFMVPLPYRIEMALSHPLRRFATVTSTYALQTLGFSALSEGNVILLGEHRIGVAEACSGLAMLLTFFALSTAVICIIKRPVLDRIIIFLSALPIALIANWTRITVTGILHETAGHEVADAVFHDLAGWLMMPFGLGLLWLELKFLDRLLVAPRETRTEAIDFAAMGVEPLRQTKPVDPPASPPKQETGIKSPPKQEAGIKNQESGIREKVAP
jgi:exosortase